MSKMDTRLWPDCCLKIVNCSSELVIHPHGATIVSWKVNGKELLFCSIKAHLDGSKPIRGGIPLVFPQFGTGPIMSGQHGFARTVPWTLSVGEDQTSMVCELVENEKTLAQWPYNFKLVYKVELEGSSLKTSFEVYNTGSDSFEFTSLLHTYLSVTDIREAILSGLQNIQYADKLKDGQIFTETRKTITIDSETDRNYFSFPHQCHLEHSTAKIFLWTDSGFTDLVLWNPWIEKARALADFDDEEYENMICLEAGHIKSPVRLEPNQSWSASQTLIAGA